ncbi:hypothetical protein V6N11_076883 [Hibiscus sabdariffa]|uniref:Uncharacterized protein n=1 Tax=Hibiscus sabdariffa TaxID=183260 RepID=A0ABR2TBF3_9ROSI
MDANASLGDNVAKFCDKATQWNRDVFGHICEHKAILLVLIRGIERVAKFSSNDRLQCLGTELKRELDIIHSQEENLWFQH